MKLSIFRPHYLLLVMAVLFPSNAYSQAPENAPVNTDGMDRGEYITKHVAMCVQCHTPRTTTGELDRTRYFHGAPMPAGAPWFSKDWATNAPNITGFLGYTDEQALHFLQTGINRSGARPRQPMPPFRMNKEDAEAVVKYLKSLS